MIRRLILSGLLGAIVCSMATAQNLNLLTNLHPRPQASYMKTSGSAMVGATTKIVISDQPSTGTMRAVAYFQRNSLRILGSTLQVISASTYKNEPNVILIGEPATFPLLALRLTEVLPANQITIPAEGYVLDVSANVILLGGADTNGTFNSVSTLTQLF
jgi:hypothetical protein